MTRCIIAVFMGLLTASGIRAQDDLSIRAANDSVSIRFLNVDLRVALQAIGRHLDRPLLYGGIGELRVSLETPRAAPVSALPDLLRGFLSIYGMELEETPHYYRVVQAQPTQQQAAAAGAPPQLQLFVIRLRHAKAADVAAAVNALYGRASALGEVGARGATLPEALQGLRIPAVADSPPGAQQPVSDRVAILGGDVTIIPDSRTNSLLVRATQFDMDLISAAVQQLDVRPLQVLIEVVIAEVRRDRSLSFGAGADLGRQAVPGTTDTELEGSTVGLGLGDFVLKVLNLAGADLSVTLRAAAARGDVSILSRPVLLAANGEPAEIMVGSQRPFVQVQRALPTDAPVRDQVIQFKDVGTRLTVIPTVSEDGYVMLHVAQEVNAATAEVAFDAPVISTRTIRTQLLVRDRHTAVLGGLADRQRDVTRSGVPLLSAIPLIGGLFGQHASRTTDTELFVFLTPRVIRTDEDLEDASGATGDRTRQLIERQLPPAAVPPPTRPPDPPPRPDPSPPGETRGEHTHTWLPQAEKPTSPAPVPGTALNRVGGSSQAELICGG